MVLKELTIRSKDDKNLILPTFMDKFDVLFYDDDFGFKPDDKLLSLVMASLTLENTSIQICETCVVTQKIYFIH